MQPTSFAEVVAGRTADGIMLSAPADFGKEFCDDESVRSVFDMFTKCPPAEMVDFFNIFVRAIEAWDVFA